MSTKDGRSVLKMHIFLPSHTKRKPERALILERVFQVTHKKTFASDEKEAYTARNEGSVVGKMTFNHFLVINLCLRGFNITKGAFYQDGSALTAPNKSSGLNCSIYLAERHSTDTTLCKLMSSENSFPSHLHVSKVINVAKWRS